MAGGDEEEAEMEGETAKILWWHKGRSCAVNKYITASQHSGRRRKRSIAGGEWRRRSKRTGRTEGRGEEQRSREYGREAGRRGGGGWRMQLRMNHRIVSLFL